MSFFSLQLFHSEMQLIFTLKSEILSLYYLNIFAVLKKLLSIVRMLT